jgi:hypothetical protein
MVFITLLAGGFQLYTKGLISLWLYKVNNKLRVGKMYLLYVFPPWAPHAYDFVVLTSLTHPRKVLLVVLQIGKAKDLSAPLLSVISFRVQWLLSSLACTFQLQLPSWTNWFPNAELSVFAEPFPSNGCLCRLHSSCLEQLCHSIPVLRNARYLLWSLHPFDVTKPVILFSI